MALDPRQMPEYATTLQPDRYPSPKMPELEMLLCKITLKHDRAHAGAAGVSGMGSGLYSVKAGPWVSFLIVRTDEAGCGEDILGGSACVGEELSVGNASAFLGRGCIGSTWEQCAS